MKLNKPLFALSLTLLAATAQAQSADPVVAVAPVPDAGSKAFPPVSAALAGDRQCHPGVAICVARISPDLGQAGIAGRLRLCASERLFGRHLAVQRQQPLHRKRHDRVGPVRRLYRCCRRCRL